VEERDLFSCSYCMRLSASLVSGENAEDLQYILLHERLHHQSTASRRTNIVFIRKEPRMKISTAAETAYYLRESPRQVGPRQTENDDSSLGVIVRY